MAELDIHYTMAYRVTSGGAHLGRDVHLIVNYDTDHPYSPAYGQGVGPAYLVTSVTGTYSVLDASGNVVRTDTITGLASTAGGGTGLHPDNLIYDGVFGYIPRVDDSGIGFTTSDTADYNRPTDGGIAFVGHISSTDYHYFEYPDDLDPASVSFTPVCFVSGTQILTDVGDRPVECLQVGDIAITASGEQRTIRWVGCRSIDFNGLAGSEDHFPVRIVAGALGPALPAEDLLVSPGHRLVVRSEDRDILVPASALVNGATVRTEAVAQVSYWHVELDQHDLLIANGTPAESYQDAGNRGFFANSSDELHRHDELAPCLPVISDPLALSAVHAALRQQAGELGWRLEQRDPNPLLVVDGQVHKPVARDGHVLRFDVPTPKNDVVLLSSVAVPCGVDMSADARQLGLRVRAITLIQSDGARAEMGQALLDRCSGFHASEGVGEARSRWTNGRAVLPIRHRGDSGNKVSLELKLGSHQLLSWVAPSRTLIEPKSQQNLLPA